MFCLQCSSLKYQDQLTGQRSQLMFLYRIKAVKGALKFNVLGSEGVAEGNCSAGTGYGCEIVVFGECCVRARVGSEGF